MPILQRSGNDCPLFKAVSVGLTLILIAGSPRAAERCMPSHISACKNTNQLVWDKSFQKEIKEFLSRQHSDYAVRGETVSDQALDVLGGPPDSPKTLGSFTLFGACMAHNCGEKGAALLNPVGQIEAIGMLDACNAFKPSPDCFANDALTVFVRGEDHRRATIAALTDWAKSAIVAENELDPKSPLPKTTLTRIQIVDITSSHRD